MEDAREPLAAEVETALSAGEIDKALALSAALVERHPEDSEVQAARGVALARSGDHEEAVIALRRAVMLDPANRNALADLAAELDATGSHEEAADLRAKVDRPGPRILRRFVLRDASIPTEEPVRGPDDPPEHRLGLGEEWTKVGWIALGFAVAAGVLRIVHSPFFVDMNVMQGKGKGALLINRDPLSVLAFYLLIVSSICAFGWMILDLYDRRARALWFAGLLGFSFCGLQALPFALYMFFRKRG